MMFFNVSKKICLRDAVFAFLLLNLYSHYRSVDLWLDVRKDSVRGRCHVRFSYLNLYSHYRSIWTCGLRMVGVGVRVAQILEKRLSREAARGVRVVNQR